MADTISYPDDREYADFYARYISSLREMSFFKLLDEHQNIWQNQLSELSEEKGLWRYETGKWSIKELMLHLIDSERVFLYRAMSISRKEQQALPGFDENEYVTNSMADRLTIEELIDNYVAVRQSTRIFFRTLPESALKEMGTASGWAISVRALAYIILGHEKHHLKVLKSKYHLNLSI